MISKSTEDLLSWLTTHFEFDIHPCYFCMFYWFGNVAKRTTPERLSDRQKIVLTSHRFQSLGLQTMSTKERPNMTDVEHRVWINTQTITLEKSKSLRQSSSFSSHQAGFSILFVFKLIYPARVYILNKIPHSYHLEQCARGITKFTRHRPPDVLHWSHR